MTDQKHTSAAPGVIGDDQLAGVGNSQQPVSGEPPRGGQATGDGFHRGSGHTSEGAEALYAFARLLEAEGAVYQRVLQRGGERSTTTEAMLQAASMARQAAYQVERKGLEQAMRKVPQLPEGDALARAVEAARVSWFRSIIGRDPQPHEFQHHQGMAMRNAILAAWPHLRAAALQPENVA